MRVSDDGDQVNALGCGLSGKARSEILDQVSEQEAGRVQRKLSRFGEGERLQVVHEAGEQFGFIQSIVDMFRRRFVDSINHAFEIALNDVERRAQFVRDIGGEVAALLLGTFEFAHHFVEALDQIAEHVGLIFRHACGKVARFHRIDGFEKIFKRTTEAHV